MSKSMLFVRRVDEDHRIILWGWGGQFLWVRRWLMRPICAWNTLLQWGHGMVAGALGSRAFSFLSCLRLSAAVFVVSSWRRAPLWTAARHLVLSEAFCSHEVWLIPKAFREALRVSLKRFFGAPSERLPSCSSPKNSFFGILWSGIRATCPAQRSCDFISRVCMLGSPARVRTSVSGTFSCQLMSSSFLSLMVWKWFNFFAWRAYIMSTFRSHTAMW